MLVDRHSCELSTSPRAVLMQSERKFVNSVPKSETTLGNLHFCIDEQLKEI